MFSATLNKQTSHKYILYFLLGWTVLNVLQASTLGVHSDEAYYWVYSRFLDWGYYDHPPMVALFIRIGDSLLQNELGLRLMTIVTSTCSVYMLWLIARQYQADVRWFIVIFLSVFAFHIYGFNTTPDAPLLFFTVLFYYLYQQYTRRDTWGTALLLALVIACLLYSKYHAVLLIFFTVLSNLKLFKRRSFYIIPILAALLYLPHILWQVHHGYPSLAYHLFERSSETYDFAHTYLFIPGQLLMAGPLVGWFLFYYGFGIRIKDAFIRALVVNGIGIFIFFFFNTVKGNVQPHWTLIGFVPLLLLVLIRLRQSGSPQPTWLFKLALVNAGLIVVFRILLIAKLPLITHMPALANYYHHDEWAQQVKQKVGNAYVIMPVGFQPASKYNYYTHSLKAFAYDEAYYRRTQYDIWPIEDSIQHKKAYYMSPYYDSQVHTDSMDTPTGKWYGGWVNNVRSYQKIDIRNNTYKLQAKAGQEVTFNLQLVSPYANTVHFNNLDKDHTASLKACFFQGDTPMNVQEAGDDFNRISIAPNQTAAYTFKLKAPLVKGNYDLIFSIRTTPFQGGRNSRIIHFAVQ
jgi:hypothetical protein